MDVPQQRRIIRLIKPDQNSAKSSQLGHLRLDRGGWRDRDGRPALPLATRPATPQAPRGLSHNAATAQ